MDTQRGRKGQKVSLVQPERPQPPAHFEPEHAAIWTQTVNRLPADWFVAESLPALEQYCEHVVSASRLTERIRAAEKAMDAPKDLDLLYKMRDREVRGGGAVARSLRITLQSTYCPDKSKGKKPRGGGVKPWERDAG
jgi:hypothetical protein